MDERAKRINDFAQTGGKGKEADEYGRGGISEVGPNAWQAPEHDTDFSGSNRAAADAGSMARGTLGVDQSRRAAAAGGREADAICHAEVGPEGAEEARRKANHPQLEGEGGGGMGSDDRESSGGGGMAPDLEAAGGGGMG